MSVEKKPRSFYKYCPVYNSPEKILQCDSLDKLEELEEYSLLNLFKHQAKFSSRTDFNDLFDTIIDLIPPDIREVESFLQQLSAKERRVAKPLLGKKNGQTNFRKYRDEINKLFDSYKMFCVTIKDNNDLMWSHYTNNHKGFCIELDASKLDAEKVSYKSELAKFKLLDIFKNEYGLITTENLSHLIKEAMLTKLEKWRYEEEYRITASHKMHEFHQLQDNTKFTIYRSNQEWVKAIIFGHRMDDKVRQYIIDTYGESVKYKVAVPDMRVGTINIIDY